MTLTDFIFSEKRRFRIRRHLAFWLLWWLAYSLLFHYPVYVFKGWSFDKTLAPGAFYNIGHLGLFIYILKTLFFNSLLAVVLPQAILTYVLLYFFLPEFFYKKKKPFVVTAVVLSGLCIYMSMASVFKYSVWFLGVYLTGSEGSFNFSLLEIIRTIPYAVRDQLTTLPIVAGFAVMIKLMKRWRQKQKETEQLLLEKSKAELQVLKAQVHPHFLFNTLNNIYFFTLTHSPQGHVMIKKLKAMLQYIITECDRPLVPLVEEIRFIKDYMELEKIRYGEEMKMQIDIADDDITNRVAGHGLQVAPLLLIPLVENSFKHGTSKMIVNPWVRLQVQIKKQRLLFCIGNSRPPENLHSNKGNIGLQNVKKRLQLLYPSTHQLQITDEAESFNVRLEIPLYTENDLKVVHEMA